MELLLALLGPFAIPMTLAALGGRIGWALFLPVMFWGTVAAGLGFAWLVTGLMGGFY